MSPPTGQETIAEQLCHFARANFVADGAGFDQHSLLAEVGVDSFALVEMLLYCERVFGVRVPLSSLTRANLTSVATLARCIAELARSSPASP